MHIRKKKILIALLFVISIVIIASASLAVCLLRGELTPVKQEILKRIPLPIALVNNQPVFSKEYIFRYQLALKSQTFNSSDFKIQNIQKDVYAAMVKQEIDRQLARKHDITVQPQRLNREYELIKNQEPDSLLLLKKYNLSEETYKEKILKPYLVETKLKIWFNQQVSLNNQAYSRMENLQRSLNLGSKFEDLSKFSQDKTSRETFGDLGFVETDKLLPEILEVVDEMKYNEIRIIASRLGLHLIQLLEKDNKGTLNSARMHLRQIFIPLSNFDQWHEKETKNFKVIKIIKI